MTLIIFLSQISLGLACETNRELSHNKGKHSLCYDQKKNSYLSKSCKDLGICFFEKKITLETYEDQSPGFSLCYQLGGEPFFGEITGSKSKIPMCLLNNQYADQESLLGYYASKIHPTLK